MSKITFIRPGTENFKKFSHFYDSPTGKYYSWVLPEISLDDWGDYIVVFDERRANDTLIIKATYKVLKKEYDDINKLKNESPYFLQYHSIDDEPSFISTYIDDKKFTDSRWHKDGVLHRDNDKPAIIINNGKKFESQHWVINGNLHRENGPAFISNDKEVWYNKGEIHRLDGPAITEHKSSDNKTFSYKDIQKGLHYKTPKQRKIEYWCVNNIDITHDFIRWANENKIRLHRLTQEDIVLIRMKWG